MTLDQTDAQVGEKCLAILAMWDFFPPSICAGRSIALAASLHEQYLE